VTARYEDLLILLYRAVRWNKSRFPVVFSVVEHLLNVRCVLSVSELHLIERMWGMCLLLICILHNQFYEIYVRLTGNGVNPSICHFSSRASCFSSVSLCNGECFTTITASIPHFLQTRQLCVLLSPAVSYIWRQYTQATKFFHPQRVSSRCSLPTACIHRFRIKSL